MRKKFGHFELSSKTTYWEQSRNNHLPFGSFLILIALSHFESCFLKDPEVESQTYKSYNYTGQWHQKLFSLFNEPRPTYFWDNFVFYVWIYFPELNKIPPMGQIITMFKNRLRLWMDFFTMMKLSAIVLGEPSLCSPFQFEPGPLFKAPYFYIVALLRWSKKTFISWRQVFF